MTDTLAVEVVLATPRKQVLLTVHIDAGATVAEVIAASGIEARFPDLAVAKMPVGVWGKQVPGNTVVKTGDRVELYRPLEIDPREARRQRASTETT
jgi:putative ubiquitin-RnfH superfamily antitoxin RatB of RatAB toxin-antitoxin module